MIEFLWVIFTLTKFKNTYPHFLRFSSLMFVTMPVALITTVPRLLIDNLCLKVIKQKHQIGAATWFAIRSLLLSNLFSKDEMLTMTNRKPCFSLRFRGQGMGDGFLHVTALFCSCTAGGDATSWECRIGNLHQQTICES